MTLRSLPAARLGASELEGNQCRFRLWAPNARRVDLHIVAPIERVVPMQPAANGLYEAIVDGIGAGTRYLYRLDGGKERPDPASQSQPEGVHEASEVIPTQYGWTDGAWRGLSLEELIFYELHVGTFTAEGTFDAVIQHLDDLVELGITALELMPVAQFPGERNWGYDGVYPGAAQHSYGGFDGLRRLVDAAHNRGLAVVLDVVYNHLGPEGNYFGEFAPYFTARYKTPWGLAMNFDGPGSDEVRRYFIENAINWLDQFHIDALRIDAVHAIVDPTASPFLKELADAVRELSAATGLPKFTIAESDLNDPRVIRPPELGGLGMDAQWSDDFHHALHALLTGEQRGYYVGYRSVADLATILRDGYLYSGQYSEYRRRRYGAPANGLPGSKFVICAQNHDQIGNRMKGDRLSASIPFGALKLAAGLTLLSPFLPLIFMGEEYAETAPFQYFTSHSDSALIEAVRAGRAEEFASFSWDGEVPDPQEPSTFERSKLNRKLAGRPEQRMLRDFYKQLIAMRKTLEPFRNFDLNQSEVMAFEGERVLMMRRRSASKEILLLASFNSNPVAVQAELASGWNRLLDSEETTWLGTGRTLATFLDSGELRATLAPFHFVIYEKSA